MEIIPAPTVEKIFIAMWNLNEAEAYRLSYAMEQEQPVLVNYLAVVDRDIFNRAERELLFYLGTVVWQVMAGYEPTGCESAGCEPAGSEPAGSAADGAPRCPPLSLDRLLQIEQHNHAAASDLLNSRTVVFTEVVKKVLQECRQSEVLRYVIAALMDENSAENEVRDEVLGYLILDLKTVIECFDQAA